MVWYVAAVDIATYPDPPQKRKGGSSTASHYGLAVPMATLMIE